MEEHIRHTDEVLGLLKEAGVSLKLKKCHLFQSKVDYLGHVVFPGKLSVAKDKTRAVGKASFSKDLTQMRSFLGACNVYRKFVPNMAKLARLLNDMLKKGSRTRLLGTNCSTVTGL